MNNTKRALLYCLFVWMIGGFAPIIVALIAGIQSEKLNIKIDKVLMVWGMSMLVMLPVLPFFVFAAFKTIKKQWPTLKKKLVLGVWLALFTIVYFLIMSINKSERHTLKDYWVILAFAGIAFVAAFIAPIVKGKEQPIQQL